jgi:hypothetical protein
MEGRQERVEPLDRAHDLSSLSGEVEAVAQGDRSMQQCRRVCLLLRDRDAKFSRSFNEVFRSEGGQVLVTPVRAPKANAYAERWVRTVRTECLDWLLIVGRGHLEQVLRTYVEHYNQHRPHRALGLEAPDPPARLTTLGEDDRSTVQRRDLLAACSTSTDKLHERVCAPFRVVRVVEEWVGRVAVAHPSAGRAPVGGPAGWCSPGLWPAAGC